jgi:branched-chain amino acid transport system permease protein
MKCGQLYNGSIYVATISAYFSGYVALHYNLPFIVILILSVIIGAVIGFIPALRLAKGKMFDVAIATIALIFIIENVIKNIPSLGGLRGYRGFPPVPNLIVKTYIILIVVGIMIHRIEHSRLGRAMEACRFQQDVSGIIAGINPIRISIISQTLAGAISAISGVIYVFTMDSIYPNSIGLKQLVLLWTSLFIGGQYSMWGIVIATPLLWGLPQIVPLQFSYLVEFIYGALLVIILVFRPQGLITRKYSRKIDSFLLIEKMSSKKREAS